MRTSFQTPRTVLTWATLEEWFDCALTIEHRRASRLRNLQAELHVRALPIATVYQCSSRATLASCDRLLRRGPARFCQPPRGQRETAPQTALIVAIANRIAQLDRAADHASISPGHNSRNATVPWSSKPPVIGPRGASKARTALPEEPAEPTTDNKGKETTP
jgi:hypothetical protein